MNRKSSIYDSDMHKSYKYPPSDARSSDHLALESVKSFESRSSAASITKIRGYLEILQTVNKLPMHKQIDFLDAIQLPIEQRTGHLRLKGELSQEEISHYNLRKNLEKDIKTARDEEVELLDRAAWYQQYANPEQDEFNDELETYDQKFIQRAQKTASEITEQAKKVQEYANALTKARKNLVNAEAALRRARVDSEQSHTDAEVTQKLADIAQGIASMAQKYADKCELDSVFYEDDASLVYGLAHHFTDDNTQLPPPIIQNAWIQRMAKKFTARIRTQDEIEKDENELKERMNEEGFTSDDDDYKTKLHQYKAIEAEEYGHELKKRIQLYVSELQELAQETQEFAQNWQELAQTRKQFIDYPPDMARNSGQQWQILSNEWQKIAEAKKHYTQKDTSTHDASEQTIEALKTKFSKYVNDTTTTDSKQIDFLINDDSFKTNDQYESTNISPQSASYQKENDDVNPVMQELINLTIDKSKLTLKEDKESRELKEVFVQLPLEHSLWERAIGINDKIISYRKRILQANLDVEIRLYLTGDNFAPLNAIDAIRKLNSSTKEQQYQVNDILSKLDQLAQTAMSGLESLNSDHLFVKTIKDLNDLANKLIG